MFQALHTFLMSFLTLCEGHSLPLWKISNSPSKCSPIFLDYSYNIREVDGTEAMMSVKTEPKATFTDSPILASPVESKKVGKISKSDKLNY